MLDFSDAGSESQLVFGAVVVQKIGQLSLLVDFPPLKGPIVELTLLVKGAG